MSDVAELAKSLAAWNADTGVPAPRLHADQISTEPGADLVKQVNDYNARASGSIDGMIRHFIDLFRAASPQERTEARKIIRQNGRRPIWQALEQWTPEEQDYAEQLRLRLACLAITYGMTDYRDDILEMNRLAKQVTEHGLDWSTFQAEYSKLAADYTPGLIDVPAMPEISEEDAAKQIQELSTKFAEHPDSAELLYQRGLVYMKSHDFDRAVQDLSAALRVDHNNAEYLYQRGTAYAGKGDVKNAFNDYVEVVSHHPNHPRADEMRSKIKEWRSLR